MAKHFSIDISFSDIFSIKDLWPDGDAPENPTFADVLSLIEDCGGLRAIISDWNLELDLQVNEVSEVVSSLINEFSK